MAILAFVLVLLSILAGCVGQGIDSGIAFIEGNINSYPPCVGDPDGFCQNGNDTSTLAAAAAALDAVGIGANRKLTIRPQGDGPCQTLRVSGFPTSDDTLNSLNGDYSVGRLYENDLFEVVSSNPYERRQQESASPNTYLYTLGPVNLYYVRSLVVSDGSVMCQWLFGTSLGSTYQGWYAYYSVANCTEYTDQFPLGDLSFSTSWAAYTIHFECADSNPTPTCASYSCSTVGFVLKASPASITCRAGGCNESLCCSDCGAGIFVSGRAGRYNLISGLYSPQPNFNGKAAYKRGRGCTQVFLYWLASRSVWAFSQTLGSEDVLAIAPSQYGENPTAYNGLWKVWKEHDVFEVDPKIQAVCLQKQAEADQGGWFWGWWGWFWSWWNPNPPRNCVGAWQTIGSCSLPCTAGALVGQQTIEFQVLSPASNGGRACANVDRDRQTISCNTRVRCGSDCVSAWDTVSICSKACGWGNVTMQYRIARPALAGTRGRACDYANGTLVTKPCLLSFCGKGMSTSSDGHFNRH